MKNGIVIPCYNEASRLDSKTFVEFIQDHTDYILCFVNDGSTDQTLELLKNMQAQHNERMYVYDMPANGGKAEAVRNGVQYLARQEHLSSIGFIDADLSTSFSDYMTLVDEMKSDSGYKDVVFGSRKAGDQKDIDRSFFRTVASALIGLMIQFIIKLPIKDTQCGAKVFSADIANEVFKLPFVTRWLFDVEIFMRMRLKYGRLIMSRIKEIPLTGWTEVEGSHITLSDSLKMPSQLVKIFFKYTIQPTIDLFQQRFEGAGYRLLTSLNLL